MPVERTIHQRACCEGWFDHKNLRSGCSGVTPGRVMLTVAVTSNMPHRSPMTLVPRLLVGISSSQDVTVTLTLDGAMSQFPTLSVISDAWTKSYAYSAAGKAWIAKLPAGDFILRIDADSTAAIKAWTVETSVPVTFANHRFQVADDPISTTVSWPGSTAISRGDPKNPWPPPDAESTVEDWYARALRVASGSVAREG